MNRWPQASAGAMMLRKVSLVLLLGAFLSGCSSLGPKTLQADQVDYARALGDAKKREILALIVGLRYADAPALLTVSQVIAGYTFTAGASAVVNSSPDPGGPAAGLTGMASFADHPTFTFTPTTGEYYARAYIHPLNASLVLPLAASGIPVDLLLRIAVQSIGSLSNAAMLGGATGNGSPGFFELLTVLRRLQLAGELSIEYTADARGPHVSVSLGSRGGVESPDAAADVQRVRELLDLPGGSGPYTISDGIGAAGARGIPVVTRSVLGILSNIGAEIAVPEKDVAEGTTKPSIQLIGGETRPIVVIHTAPKITGVAYASIVYRRKRFWIDDADFDSKYALTIVQDLMALAQETDTSHSPLVTVPAS